MATRTKRAKRAPGLSLTPVRREKVLRAFRDTGIYARAAAAAGVDDSTLRTWRTDNPDFQAELDMLRAAYDLEVGQKARCALSQELDRFIAGEPIHEQAVVQRDGSVVTLEQPRQLNVSAVRTALTKLDRDWTHPKQEVDVSATITLDESISRAAAKLRGEADE